jgi:ribosomal protein S5
MVTALIDFIQLVGSHSGKNMAKAAFETLKELNMKDKVSQELVKPP